MALASTAALHNWSHDNAEDAAKEILAAVGDISGLEIFGSQVLLGVYVRPVKTRGGLLTVANSQREDIYQGCVAMVLKIGPTALDSLDEAHFGGSKPAVGDWVYSRVADCYQTSIKGPGGTINKERQSAGWSDEGWPCRLVYAADIYGRVQLPNMIVSG